MKKIGALFLCVFMLTILVGLGRPALVYAAETYVRISVTGTNVNVRAGANTSSKVLTRANPGDTFVADSRTVTNLADGSQWYRIVFAGSDDKLLTAYIRSDFASVTKLNDNENKKISALLALYGEYAFLKALDINGNIKVPNFVVSSLTIKESNTYELVFYEKGSEHRYTSAGKMSAYVDDDLSIYGGLADREWQFELIDDRNDDEPSYIFAIDSLGGDDTICVLLIPQGVGDNSWLENADFCFLEKVKGE